MIESQQIKKITENHKDLERLIKSLLSEEEVSMRVYSVVMRLMSCYKTTIELISVLHRELDLYNKK